MGYFQNFFSSPDKVIPSSLPRVCLFHLILSFAISLRETFHHRSVQLLLPSCFYIPPPVIHREWRWGVCHHLLCSEGSGSGVYARCVFMCAAMEVCEEGVGGGYWGSGCRGEWAGWAKPWWEVGGQRGDWRLRICNCGPVFLFSLLGYSN